jgi:hypothetical protein
VPITWSTNGQIMLAWKYGAGKVAKILNVAVESALPPSAPRVMWWVAS